MIDAKKMLHELLDEMPSPGFRTVAHELLKEVARDAEIERIRLLWGTPVGEWVKLLQEYNICDINNLRVELERAKDNV